MPRVQSVREVGVIQLKMHRNGMMIFLKLEKYNFFLRDPTIRERGSTDRDIRIRKVLLQIDVFVSFELAFQLNFIFWNDASRKGHTTVCTS